MAHDVCYLYLVRHGATANNLAHPPRLQGRGVDLELSADGLDQARRVARLLAEVKLAAVYSSPLLRARQTAAEVAALHELDVWVAGELIEADVGSWEGKTWEEIAERDPQWHAQFLDDPARFGYLDGENLQQVRDRALPVVQQLMEQHAGQKIAVVAHKVVNRVVLAEMLGLPLSRARELPQDNGGINILRRRSGKREIVCLNSCLHLSTLEE